MTFSAVTARGSATETTSSSAFHMHPSANLTVGKFVVVCVTTDNYVTSKGASTEHTVTDSQSNSWTKAIEYTESDGIAADGVTVSTWYTKITTQIGTGDEIRIALGNAVARKIISTFEATITKTYVTHAAVGVGQTSLTATVTGLNQLDSYLLIGHTGAEGSDTTKTPGTDYTEVFDLVATDIGQHVQRRITSEPCGFTEDTVTSTTWTNTNPMSTLVAFQEYNAASVDVQHVGAYVETTQEQVDVEHVGAYIETTQEQVDVEHVGAYIETTQEKIDVAFGMIYVEASAKRLDVAQGIIYVEVSPAPIMVSQIGAYIETEQIIVKASQLGAYVETERYIAVVSQIGAYIESEQIAAKASQIGAYVETDILFSTPGEDIEDGDWTDQVGTSNLSPAISEYTINDTTYVHKSSPEVDDYFEVLLADPFGNLSTEELELEWRAYNAGDGTVTMKCELVQGTTVIATDIRVLTGTPTTYTKTLTQEEYDSITDEEDLRLRFTVTVVS